MKQKITEAAVISQLSIKFHGIAAASLRVF